MPYSQDSNGEGAGIRRNDLVRRPGPWIVAIFELEDVYTDIPGWLPQEIVPRENGKDALAEPVTWNGWDCPHFEKSSADLIVRQHNDRVQSRARESGREYPADLLARYDADSDSYLFFLINGYDRDECSYSGEWESFSGITVEVQPGNRLRLYPVGAWSWTWESSDSDSHG